MHWWQIRKRNSDLDRELASDLELEEEEQRERGASQVEARYAALRAFGNPALIREQTREAWGWTALERFWHDVRFSLRSMTRNKRFASVCVITLALGIGAQTTIYSVVHAVLIDPFPYRGAMRMVHLHLYDKDPVPDDLALNGPQFAEFEKLPMLDGAIADDVYTMSLPGQELPEQLSVSRMSPNAFDYFGVPPLLGRGFTAADRNRVAVLSYRFWKSHYAGRADVLGHPIELNRENYAIIGVMPERFAWMWGDVYVPLVYSSDPHRISNVFARVREGVSDSTAEQAIQPILSRFAAQTPADFPLHFKVHLVHINEIAIGRFRGALVLLFISVSLLLALACANLAILMLARGEARQSEIAMRKALGAGSGRIVAQLLTESITISSAGGALGILLALAGVKAVLLLTQPLPTFFPPEAKIAVDVPVLAFGVAVSMLTGILCGLWPALRASRTDIRHAANSDTYKLAGRRGSRLAQMVLLATQIAITILLLASSGATLRGLIRLLHTNLGYNPENLASVELVLREGAHNEWADRVHYFEQIRAAIASAPDLASSAIGILPPSGAYSVPVDFPGQKIAPGRAVALDVNQDYFSTLGIPVLAGRVWTPDETAHGARLALISEAMRRRFWPVANPIGATVELNNGIANPTEWKRVAPGDDQHFRVIGVVGDVPNRGLDEDAAPAVYVPYSMTPFDGFTISFRTRGSSVGLLHAIKERVRAVEADQAVGDLNTAAGLLEGDSIGRDRFLASLFAAFAFLALAFAVSGLYGIQSYLVALRTRELGVRIALGARRIHVVDQVVRQSLLAVAMGAAAGVAADLAWSRIFDQWTNANVRDPLTLASVAGVLLLAVLAASAAPALAATSIDPIHALRAA